MLGKFIHILNRSKTDLDDLQIAEALWLSRYDTVEKEPVAEDQDDHAKQPGAEYSPSGAPSPASSQSLQPEKAIPSDSKSIFAADDQTSEGKSVPVSQIRAPGVSALPAALLISRALRPFSRRVDSNLFEAFDEKATVELSAELSQKKRPLILPVMKPAKERWFEAALVVEETPSMAVWRSTIGELAMLLGRHGAFRDVRLWRLKVDGQSARIVSAKDVEADPKTIGNGSSRRLLMLISDCVSPQWRDGSIARQIAAWSETMPVVIGHMLSERLWRRTALGEPTAEIKAPHPDAVNKDLKITDIKWWDQASTESEADVESEDKTGDSLPGQGNRIACPVISLDPKLISQWATMATGSGKRYKAALLSPEPQTISAPPQKNPADSPKPESRIERYRKMVSPEAFDLAVFLSMMPLALPVMRVVQRAMIPNPRQEQLAEFLLGGLLKRKNPSAEHADHDNIQYDFQEGVRELLRSELRPEEIPLIISCVSEFIGQRIRSIHDFLAWAQDAEGNSQIEGALPFAQIGLDGLEHLGYSRRAIETNSEIIASSSGASGSAAITTQVPTVETQIESLLNTHTNDEREAVNHLLKLAENFAASGKVDDALTVYQKIIEQFPELPDGWNALAKYYLKESGAVPGAQLLRAGLQHENEVARIYAVQALASLDLIISVDEVRALIETLSSDESEVVRAVAAKVLAQFPGDEVEAALWARMRDDLSETVRTAAAKSYETITRDRPNSYFFFETVTLDERGDEIQRRRLSAHQFVEDLGDGVTLEMVEIPGGSFLMGTSDEDVEREKDEIVRYRDKDTAERWISEERPQHEVTVAPFYIGKFTITQRQWRMIANWPKIERDLKSDPSHFKGEDRPVESISWEDSQELCARLAKRTGRAYRLPTEAEWEYACRANTTTPFAFGETITHETVNYWSEKPYAKAPEKKQRGETTPVGSFGIANGFGLFEMHGNVWEWCEDVWHQNYDGAPKDGSAWLSNGDSSYRVVRGGSWGNDSNYCRSADRDGYDPGSIYDIIGVRLVVSARTPST